MKQTKMSYMKQVSIIAIMMSISAMCFGQEQEQATLDTIPITAPAHLAALPELIKESNQLRQQEAILKEAIRNNNEKVMILLSSYVDPQKIQGVTEDLKNVVAKE